MHLPKPRFHPLPFACKIVGIMLVACFLLIGLAGLILPIIPGILFLFLALYVLTRISRRAAAYAHRQPWFDHGVRQMHATDGLSVGERCKLGLLVLARGMVNGVEWGVSLLKRIVRS